MKKFVLLIVGLLSFSVLSFSQQTGEIQGRIVDQNNVGIPFANVVVLLNDVQVNGTATDFDGFFTIKPLNPGKYQLIGSYIDKKITVNDVIISAGKTTFLDKLVINTAQELKTVTVKYEAPPVDVGKPESGDNITREEIEKMPKNNLVGIIGNSGGTYQQDDNNLISIGGSRSYATKYLIDGVDLTGIVELPTDAIDQVQIITGGVDASQGDFTGGVVSISTRGPSRDIHGSAEVITSQYLDAFGYNQGKFSLLGPLVTRYKGTDTARSVLGYLLTAEILYEKDSDPPAVAMTKVQDDVLANLKETPLIPSKQGEGFNKSTEFLRTDDLEEVKYKMNNDNKSINAFGKLDFKPSLTSNLTLGSSVFVQDANAYIRTFSLLNWENNPKVYDNDYRVYLKYTQRFITKQEKTKSEGYKLSNAYYSIQADWQKRMQKVEDAEHKDNPFHYGYIGKFKTYKRPVYFYATDSLTGKNAFMLFGYQDTAVTFVPGTLNEDLTRYTEIYYADNDPSTLALVQLGGGLRNGDFTNSMITYSMYYNPGVPYTSYNRTNNDQFGMRFDASFDLKKTVGDKLNKHAFQFGFEYQQRIDRYYSVGPLGLWSLARQNANFHLSNLDLANPYYLIDGDTILWSDYNGNFGEFDTIYYDRKYSQTDQKFFDISVREKLGIPVNSLEWLDIDALDPDFLSLDMFSPDELLAGGNRLVNTQGYDYYGNLLTKQPAFSDFFYKYDDKNGNGKKDFNEYYTRDLGAYRPIYTAAYLQDRFNIGRVIFRVGLRVDRFDANQKVLRDKYSLYAIRSAEEVSGLGTHPGTIGSDYAVYVDDVQNPTTIVGYRDGDTWYNAEGNEIFDPAVLAAQSSTGTISPYLVDPTANIKDPDNFEVDQSFEDYNPQFTAMPRIAFSFPITETAMFTAHYDVLTQRPFSRNEATPYHYYYMQELAIDGVIPNPNLRPEKTINYQLGFQQALSDHSALKISAFYKELRDMMQVVAVNYAYPLKYNTYGNVDFGTVKGLTVTYDLIRRVSNMLMTASYTLQFADGTGSNTTSQVNLIGAGQPNLRTIVPLDYDVRHTFNLNVDYRFSEGDQYTGPKWGNSDFLENAGINVSFRGRSGEPFTRQANPTPTAQFGVRTSSSLAGTINGSRLPWNFKIDARIDKDFSISSKDKKPLYLNVYFLVQNLLDTRNVINVYAYTGSATDDGYLAAPATTEVLAGQVDPISFMELYAIKMNNPSNYSLPRRMQIGAKLKF